MAADFMLSRTPITQSFGGCGAQFNNNVYAKQTLDQDVAKASFRDLEKKVLTLAPQFVRIFYNDNHAGVPFVDGDPKSDENVRQRRDQVDRWESFVNVVKLAQQAGAMINITWSGGAAATDDERATSMKRFAHALDILVKHGFDQPVKPAPGATGTARKRLVAFGLGDELTILGLHTDGATSNKTFNTRVPYTIGNLPHRTRFQLLFWNERGGGGLVRSPTPITTDAGGVATVTAPLHSVFALTTKALPANLV